MSGQALLECAGAKHVAGSDGHDGKLAAFIVHARCPGCGWTDDVPMCAGRVERIRKDDGDFTHGVCGTTTHWSEMWTLEPIEAAVVASPIVLSDVESPTEDVLAAYVEYLESRGRANGTIALRMWHLRKLQQVHADLRSVTPEDLYAWVRESFGGLKPSTINNAIKSVGTAARIGDI